MNRARKKTYKIAASKRLVSESLFLSCTRFASSRIVRFFKTGFVSPLIASVKKVDSFARDKITGPLLKMLGIRKKFYMPARNAVAAAISRSPVMKKLSAFMKACLNMSMRSVGVFLITFGLYTAGIFLLKRYISSTLGVADTNDLAFGAISALVGLLLAGFGDKSVMHTLGTGRITGSLLYGCLGMNPATVERYSVVGKETHVGIGFIIGSLLGAATLFFTPASVMLAFAAVVLVISVLNIPEFGLLLLIATFTFVPVEYSALLSAVTLASFLIKCVRLKRNFRFGTADAVVMVTFVFMLISFLVSDSAITVGERYVLCFTFVYFLAKNLLCSEKLVFQAFNALTVGLSFGMALYILGEFAWHIPHEHFRNAAVWMTRFTLSHEMMIMLASVILPFAFFSYSGQGTKKSDNKFVLLAITCAVITDSFIAYAIVLSSLFVYILFTRKAPVGTIIAAGAILTPMLVVINDFTSSSIVSAGKLTAIDSIFGTVTKAYGSFWTGMSDICGPLINVLVAVAIVFMLQRVLGACIIDNSVRTTRVCGTVAASAVMLLACLLMFNPFSDIRTLLCIWFIFGLCGSAYKVCSNSKYVQEV